MRHILSFVALLALTSLFLFLPACEPTCSTNDDCDSNEVCRFALGKCATSCDPMKADSCPTNFTCDSCASGSCPMCEDCVPACVEISSPGGGQGGW